MVSRQAKRQFGVAMRIWLGACWVASFGSIAACQSRAGEVIDAPTDTKRTELSDDRPFRLHVIPRNGQLCVHATYGPTEYVCLASGVDLDESPTAIKLGGKVIVEVKGKKTMYAGERVVVYPKKEVVVVEERNQDHDPTVLSRERRPMQRTSGEKIWSDYKVEFLVRMGSRIDVLTLSDTEPSMLAGGSVGKAATVRTLLADRTDACKAGERVSLVPATESKKIMLVNYFGQEPRNWIPYDESIEDKILALIKIGDGPITDASLNELRKLRNLKVLDLYRAEISDDGLNQLGDLKNLRELDLSRTQITDSGLNAFRECKSLTTLGLEGTQITDAGLKQFRELKNLTMLDLDSTQITDAGLKELRDLTNLTTLRLNYTPITDAGLKELRRLTNLTTLRLNYTQLTDAGLKELRGLTNLAELQLNGTQITDAGLMELKRFRNLTALSLRGTQITAGGLKELKAFKNLTSLSLSGLQIKDADLTTLKKEFKDLAMLDLKSTQITDGGLKELRGLKHLTQLEVNGTEVTDGGAKELSTFLPKLRISR